MKSEPFLVGLIVCGLLIGCCVAGCTTPSTNATPTTRVTTAVTTGAGGAPATATSAATTAAETPLATPTETATVTTVAAVITTAPAGGESPTVTATTTPTPTGTEYIEQDSGQIPNFIYVPPSGAVTLPVTTVPPVTTVTTLVPTATFTTRVPTTVAPTPVPTTMVMTTVPTVTTIPPTTVTTAPTVTTVPPTTVATTVPTIPGAVTIPLSAQNLAFSMSTITVPAGAQVTITFTNNDAGVPHNVAVYTDSSAATNIFRGAIVTGPATTTYSFTAPSTPGSYFFRCDVHPTIMTGTFVVQ